MTAKFNVYEMVTDQIVAKLQAGTVPWRMPWRITGGSAPANLVTGKAYRGINVFLLGSTGHASPWWLTFRQMEQLGGHLRKINGADEKGTGQQSSMVVFWQMIQDRDRPDDPNAVRPFLRYSRVFNLDQTEDVRIPKGRIIDPDDIETVVPDPIDAAQVIIDQYLDAGGPSLNHGGDRAYYSTIDDHIQLPARPMYWESEEYYQTAFHELGHSTGHPGRLDRLEKTYFGSHSYGREELVAEMTAAFLANEAGIDSTQDNSAAYLASWIRTIQEDVRAVVVAAGKAQKAADLILGRTPADDDHDDQRNKADAVLVDT
jgi:antirestriction protein ArdC